ncbi:MAG: hypothetical protein KIS87_10335 [Phycisphaeraceae bacterium]|nr:hypothetical protein [Phycisphaeraceae bacterium]
MGGNESGRAQSDGGFARAFLPGLVLGLIIGAFAGSVITPMLRNPHAPSPGPTMQQPDREEQPVAPAVEEPEEEVVEQGDQPSEEEPDGGG